MSSAKQFELGAVGLQHGGHLPAAQLTYKTHGTLNARKDNVIVFPTWCAGNHEHVEWIIGPGRSLDPARYFIVVIDILGNGKSSSPSNTPSPFDRTRFPRVSILDNVLFQRRMLTEVFGIDRIKLVIGRSMGAQLAFQWGSYFPDDMDKILPMCGSAKTSHHNYIYLATMKMALTADPDWQNGEYEVNPEGSLRRMRLNYDAWGSSQAFYRQGLHLSDKHPTTQSYLNRADPISFGDVNDLLAQFATWEAADISDNERFHKDFPAALRAIKAKALIMPSQTDLYFPPQDSEIEVAAMPNATLRPIPSVWGHRAAAPGSDPNDIEFFDRSIGDLLEDRI